MKAIELEKAYDPKSFEDRIYSAWEAGGCFKPASDADSPVHAGYEKKAAALTPEQLRQAAYTVVIPPPNVTGVLHVGHGLNNVLQDIAVRYHRMKGDNTVWITGTDHAGIATQNVVERQLKKEGKTRDDLGRGKFLERTWALKEDHHATIVRQQRRLGNSTDWTRERFTMDEGLSKAVRDVFCTLYERGLIYKGKYLVNWCPRCGTALSDDEVEHTDTAGAMYHIWYEFADGPAPDGSDRIEIATTRPETLLGDTAVAVNPDDGRYKSLVGKKLRLPLAGRIIPLIADSYVDKEFGTGMVKITPAHDPNDYQVGQRNHLEMINILNPDGTLNENCPEKYRGLSCAKARPLIIEDLKALGLFKGEEKITHSVGHCYRCGAVVEPYLSDQWFVRMRPLADKAMRAWERGEIVFYPRKWENTYTHWLENIRDWCISRQLWWGHRIPVWYCGECGQMTVSREEPDTCPKCGAGKERLRQDPDVLDTWFSSWLWPFSTLGWPENTADFQTFYPTTALVTAYDIIFFWVSRMIMAGLEFTGRVPFRDIYIHGLVRDKQGRKMSKSLGNGIDPLEIIDEYGADAFKFTLGFMCAQGQDVLIDRDSFKLGSRFANKVWNAGRYILGNLEGRELVPVSDGDLTELDRWIYTRLDAAVRAERAALEGYRYNDAAAAVFEYFWNEFCDWYVEATKLSFRDGGDAEKDRAVSVLLNVLEENLRLLHPFLPFVTEEIYGKLPLKEIAENRAKAFRAEKCGGGTENAARPQGCCAESGCASASGGSGCAAASGGSESAAAQGECAASAAASGGSESAAAAQGECAASAAASGGSESAAASGVLPRSLYAGMLINAPFPEPSDGRVNQEIASRFSVLKELISKIRFLRAECGLDPAAKIHVAVLVTPGSAAEICREKTDMIGLLAGCARTDFVTEKPARSVGMVGTGFEAFIIADESINKEQLLARFNKSLENEKAAAEKSRAKLSGNFAAHAPADVVEAEREKLAECTRKIEKLTSYIAGL